MTRTSIDMKEKAEKIAQLARQKIPGGKVLSLQLSDKNSPHFAKILLQNFQNKRIAVIAELQKETAENLITYSMLWYYKLSKLKTKAAEKIWIISTQSKKLAQLCVVLKDNWQRKINIYDHLLIEKFEEIATLKKPKSVKEENNALAERIISLSPEEIQHQGRNLTFRGLPFAKLKGEEIWFGIESQNQLLHHSNWTDLLQLIENLQLYRQDKAPQKNHIFYQQLPEAWLESSLRNDISVIDANLILSPVHHQFRTSFEQIDLLALRKDGRLVIIELKVSPNQVHLFQAVDYWQEIEKQRLAGNLRGLFDNLEIANQPSLVYLVAPHSCFHPDFKFLASLINSEIEVYRFDLNENWRTKVKVLEQNKI